MEVQEFTVKVITGDLDDHSRVEFTNFGFRGSKFSMCRISYDLNPRGIDFERLDDMQQSTVMHLSYTLLAGMK